MEWNGLHWNVMDEVAWNERLTTVLGCGDTDPSIRQQQSKVEHVVEVQLGLKHRDIPSRRWHCLPRFCAGAECIRIRVWSTSPTATVTGPCDDAC